MRTRIRSFAEVFVCVSGMLAAAVGCASEAGADTQEDQFVASLAQQQIPALDNVPGLVYRAKEICGELDGGASFQNVLDEETNITYGGNPSLRMLSDRVTRTAVRFITASVTVYCPSHQGQLP